MIIIRLTVFKINQQILNTLKLEIQELESEVAGSSEKVDKAKQVIVDCEKKIEEFMSILKEENVSCFVIKNFLIFLRFRYLI